jgi:hypothetical protein
MMPPRPLPAILAALLLAGCTTTTTPPAPDRAASTPTVPARPAAPPAAPADTRPATLKGSEESSTLLDNFTAFIRAIDGQPVAAGRKGWDQALSLAPGSRRVSVEFMRGSFYARTELNFDAKPGAAYELRQANDAQVYGEHSFCEFWIVDLATGEKVGTPKRVALEKVKAGGK